MKKVWLTIGMVCAVGLVQGDLEKASAASGAKSSSSGWMVMFEEPHKKKYYSGRLRETGKIAQVCQSNDGKHCKKTGKQTHVRHGKWTYFWPNGEVKAIQHYDKGLLDGSSQGFYQNGNKRWDETFVKGERNGERTVWFKNGKLKLTSHYKDGLLHGASVVYWWNGEMSSAGSYHRGKKVGTWKSWYLTGHQRGLVNYTAGVRNGLNNHYWYICRPTGCGSVKMKSGYWKDGKKDGRWKYCAVNADGKINCSTQTY